LKLKDLTISEFRGFPGNPQPFQEVNSLSWKSAAFAGRLVAFRELGAAIFEALMNCGGFSQ
jgi:hypothetical protein